MDCFGNMVMKEEKYVNRKENERERECSILVTMEKRKGSLEKKEIRPREN